MSLPFQVRQSTAKQIYGRQMHSLLEAGRLHDQSVALERDPDAYEKMFLDADIAHLKQVRKHLVAGSRFQFLSASSHATDVKAANVMQKIFDIGLGESFVEGRFNLAEAVFRGSSYQRINGHLHWSQNLSGDRIPYQVWVPDGLVDVDRRRFDKIVHHVDRGLETERYEVEWRMFDVVHNDWRTWDHPEWYVKHVYNADEASLGYGRGLIDAMYFYWRAKEILLKSGLQGAQRWALGFMVASVDNARSASSGKTNQAIVNSFIAELKKQTSQNFFVMDKLDELQVLPGPGQGWEIVKFMLEYCDKKLRQLCLGANLPTEANKGGSYALAEMQQNTTDVLVKFDRRLLSQTLTRDLVGLTWMLNRNVFFSMGLGAAEMPRLVIVDEKINDPKLQAEITEILLRSGVRQKASEVYELSERTMPGLNDDVIEPLNKQLGAKEALGGGGFDAGSGSGHLPTPHGKDGKGKSEFVQGAGGRLQGRKPATTGGGSDEDDDRDPTGKRKRS